MLQPHREQLMAAPPNSPGETSGKIRGIFAIFLARNTASLSLVAEGEKLEKTLLEFVSRPSL
jgi:hypothetical protein